MDHQLERKTFENHLKADRFDESSHKIYADWLDEHDEPEAADWHRNWTPERQVAEDWLRELAVRAGQTCVSGYGSDHDEDELWRNVTYEDVVLAGHNYKRTGEFFTQVGSDMLRDLMDEGSNAEKYWKCWSLVTGEEPPGKDEFGRPSAPFSCSC